MNVGERLDDAIDILRNHAEGQQLLGPNSFLSPPNNTELTTLEGHVVIIFFFLFQNIFKFKFGWLF